MHTAKGLIYGAKPREDACPEVASEPESYGCDPDGMGCASLPCEACEKETCAEESEGRKRSAHENGKVWWNGYEAPDKPIDDFTAREVGVHGEALAARYLASRGMSVLQQNWRSKAGEVDIVARDEDGEVALVEVKTRLDLDGDPQCMPELAVDGRKQQRYRKIALVYLMCHPEVLRMRFDVIAINILDRHNARLRHLVGAFCWDS